MSKLTDYKPLTRNPNKGTQRGTGILEQSVRELGAGRSILVDKNGIILAGNHAQEAFVNAGMDDVIEVETDGKQIVVVKRTDLDADSSAGKKMAIMDNRTSEQGLAWDAVVVEDLLNEIKQDEGDLDNYLKDLENQLDVEMDIDDAFGMLSDEDRAPFRQMTFTVHDNQFEVISEALRVAKSMGEFDSENENSNGNAITRVCEMFLGEHGNG
jgi:hypothetical protein